MRSFYISARGLLGTCALAMSLGLIGTRAGAEDWLPIATEDLQMKGDPKAPKAPAVILYRQVDRDDNGPSESVYVRIKILTEEGRQYADVSIPYLKYSEQVRGIEARTIHPDGGIVKFDGNVYDTTLAKTRDANFIAKTFTLPDVQVGSIIEYRYRHYLRAGYVFNSHWILSDALFTRAAKFSLAPYPYFSVRYSWPIGLPAGTDPPQKSHGRYVLETHDVPPFISEDDAPPEDELKFRVDFIYLDDDDIVTADPDVFWTKYAKRLDKSVEHFVDKPGAMQRAVAGIIAPGDTPEAKLRKIYARTQELRNTSFEPEKTDEEARRAKEREASSVDDVWTRGYGDGEQITWLFMALARAAGFQADPVLVPTRDLYFFEPRLMNPGQLNTNLVVIRLDGQDLYLDPGTVHAPFGVLPWRETAVKCLRLKKDGGSWVVPPLPKADESRVERTGTFTLDSRGDLNGTLTVTYSGNEALWRRIRERNEDEIERKRMLENEIKSAIPTGSDVTLSTAPAWDRSDPAMVAEFAVTVPNWAASAGQRRLMNVGLFSGNEAHRFERTFREHPVYFEFPHETRDDLTIALPAGWQPGSLPKARHEDRDAFRYVVSVDSRAEGLHVTRELVVNTLLVRAVAYAAIHDFYQTVRSADEEQIVLSPAKAPAKP
jgi:hypothetical protein